MKARIIVMAATVVAMALPLFCLFTDHEWSILMLPFGGFCPLPGSGDTHLWMCWTIGFAVFLGAIALFAWIRQSTLAAVVYATLFLLSEGVMLIRITRSLFSAPI